jgi:hypothetical protein
MLHGAIAVCVRIPSHGIGRHVCPFVVIMDIIHIIAAGLIPRPPLALLVLVARVHLTPNEEDLLRL